MQLLATQSISSSTINTKFKFLVGINTSYFGSVRICMPKKALEISELMLPASDPLPRLDNTISVP
jgi:hypothetical protein